MRCARRCCPHLGENSRPRKLSVKTLRVPRFDVTAWEINVNFQLGLNYFARISHSRRVCKGHFSESLGGWWGRNKPAHLLLPRTQVRVPFRCERHFAYTEQMNSESKRINQSLLYFLYKKRSVCCVRMQTAQWNRNNDYALPLSAQLFWRAVCSCKSETDFYCAHRADQLQR